MAVGPGTSNLKDNDNTGCTNVEDPCKYSARMGDKSAVIHCCYLHCFRKSVPNCFLSTSQMSFSLNKHLCLLWVDLELDTAGEHQSVDPGQGIVDGVVALKGNLLGLSSLWLLLSLLSCKVKQDFHKSRSLEEHGVRVSSQQQARGSLILKSLTSCSHQFTQSYSHRQKACVNPNMQTCVTSC